MEPTPHVKVKLGKIREIKWERRTHMPSHIRAAFCTMTKPFEGGGATRGNLSVLYYLVIHPIG
jgi:hypothetical protein